MASLTSRTDTIPPDPGMFYILMKYKFILVASL